MNYEPRPDTPVEQCPYCGQPFPEAEILLLHKGIDHPEDLSSDEREAYEEARRDEDEELRLFKLKSLVALVALYFGFIMVYAVFA
jgi:hypothetical protein